MSAFQQPPTFHGFNYFEVLSALQKSIRQNNEKEAIYWANEIFISGKEEALWKRLFIICSEDIGIANPNLPAQIWALYEMYKVIKKSDTTGNVTLPFIHAVLLLCRSEKTRINDHWANIVLSHLDDFYPNKEMPDYAYDKHTTKGKSLGRGAEHFYKEATKLSPHADIPLEKDLEAFCYKQDIVKVVKK